MNDETNNDQANSAQTNDENNQPEFSIQRLYIKDLSVESPNSPKIFLEQWEPDLNIDLNVDNNSVENDLYEVILTVTATVKIKDQTAFLVEVKQAGIFSMKGFPEDQIKPMLGSFCPNLLYPYAREAISSAVTRAGFPQLYLAPVNFDALYQQHEEQEKQEK
jgi:preprotein translocase subunit SecB